MSTNLPIQTVYNLVPAVAFAGQLADSGNRDTESALAETACDAGMGLTQGAQGSPTQTVKIPASSGDVTAWVGVSYYMAAKEPQGYPTTLANRYAIGDPVPILTQGRIWVAVDATAGASLVDNGPVYLVYSGASAGKFRGDTGGGTAALVSRAVCKVGAAAGGVAQIKINLP